ncbi:rhomboid family intramembrane serine protease, partial [Methylobacterium radiotolerans]
RRTARRPAAGCRRPGRRDDPELLRNRTAVSFLVIWLLTNLLFGLVSVPLVGENAAIAWDAHLGGFIAGFFLFPLVDPREPRRH